jgi:hypothetical protein
MKAGGVRVRREVGKPVEIDGKRVVVWTLFFTDAFFVSYFVCRLAGLI